MKTEERVSFSLGQTVATPGAIEALAKNNVAGMTYILRHARGDWGEIDEEDQAANAQALIDGSRLMSAYSLPDGEKLWVITDAVIDENNNRQATTLLLPEEY